MRRTIFHQGKKHLLLIISLLSSSLFACNLSQVTLLSFSQVGMNYQIQFQLCIGGGITGATRGADQPTMDIAFGFYSNGGAPMNIVGFSPASIQESYTNCNMPLSDVGAVPVAPFFSQATLYASFDAFNPGCSNGYSCIMSTASCGNAHQNCYTITVTVDALPDSMRVFGVEGAGNPTAGCFPNPDMKLTFGSLPVVFSDFTASVQPGGVQLHWASSHETNLDHYEVRWAEDEHHFETLDWVYPGQAYSYFDQRNHPGLNLYRIVGVDANGTETRSQTETILLNPSVDLSQVQIFPNPTQGEVVLQWGAGFSGPLGISVYRSNGHKVWETQLDLERNASFLRADLSDLAPGLYGVELNYGGEREVRKLLIQGLN